MTAPVAYRSSTVPRRLEITTPAYGACPSFEHLFARRAADESRDLASATQAAAFGARGFSCLFSGEPGRLRTGEAGDGGCAGCCTAMQIGGCRTGQLAER